MDVQGFASRQLALQSLSWAFHSSHLAGQSDCQVHSGSPFSVTPNRMAIPSFWLTPLNKLLILYFHLRETQEMSKLRYSGLLSWILDGTPTSCEVAKHFGTSALELVWAILMKCLLISFPHLLQIPFIKCFLCASY